MNDLLEMPVLAAVNSKKQPKTPQPQVARDYVKLSFDAPKELAEAVYLAMDATGAPLKDILIKCIEVNLDVAVAAIWEERQKLARPFLKRAASKKPSDTES
jgi:hypothetical protein